MIDPDEWEIVEGFDVGHLDDRPDDLEHVAIKENADGDLRAVPFRESGPPPGYVEIDADLMEYDAVCRYVEQHSDYGRRICFVRTPGYPPDGPTATDPHPRYR